MNIHPSGDEELALQIQRGDHAALTPLVERYHNPVMGFIYRLTGGDRLLAEDLIQETFLRALRSIDGYHYPRPFRPWLYAIALNLARDHYRQAEVRYVETMEEDFEPAGGERPEEHLQASEEARRIRSAIFTLREGQREAILLRYYQNLSLAETAEVLSVPVGTVKSRICLGLRRLKDCLDHLEEERDGR